MSPEEFRAILERRGLTQQQAADLLGYSRLSVNFWATGRQPITPAAAALIRTVLTVK
jgi:DNA-binding transcriptional regulator YiaG